MIEWIPLNPITAPDEVEENSYLIYTNGRIVMATHDAMQRYFSYEREDCEVVIPYRYISHYAEYNIPTTIQGE